MNYNSLFLKRLKTVPLNFNIQLYDGLRKLSDNGFIEIYNCYFLKSLWYNNTDHKLLEKRSALIKDKLTRTDHMQCEWDKNDFYVSPMYTSNYILENSIIFTDLLLKQWSKKHPDKKLLIGIIITEDAEGCDPLELTKFKILVERPSPSPFFQNIENDSNNGVSVLVANSFDDLDLVNEVKKLQSKNAL